MSVINNANGRGAKDIPPRSKARPSLLRFGLRGLFVFIFVVAVALGWMIRKARSQATAVAALEQAGFACSYASDIYEGPQLTMLERLRKLLGDRQYRNVVALHVAYVDGDQSLERSEQAYGHDAAVSNPFGDDREVQLSDASLAHVHELTDLVGLEIHGAAVTDAGLTQLAALSQLKGLDVSHTSVTDGGLRRLDALSRLESLGLRETPITDAGFNELLPKLTQLKRLYLDNTRITDAGLKRLCLLSQLNVLDLGRTRVTDATLQRIKCLKSVTNLNVRSTAVTAAGIIRLADMTRLRDLHIDEAQVAAVGRYHLKGIAHLAMDAQLCDVGIRKLERAFPHCKIWRHQVSGVPADRD